MKLDLEKVKEKFYGFCGETPTDGEREILCSELCGECTAWVQSLTERRLGEHRGETISERLAEGLVSLAAAEAFYELTLIDEALAPKSITADGVTVNAGEGSQRAKQLVRQKERLVEEILGEESFCFRACG